MKLKFFLLTILLTISITGFSQEPIDKSLLSNNWMVYSLIHPSNPGKKVSRLEMKKEPKADFIINAAGEYNVRFDNIGEGTWRLEENFLIFWGQDSERPKIEAVYKIEELQTEKLVLKLLWMTKHYDWEIELVPFN